MFCIFFFFFNEAVNVVTEERTAGKSRHYTKFSLSASATTETFSHSVFYTTAQKRSLSTEGR